LSQFVPTRGLCPVALERGAEKGFIRNERAQGGFFAPTGNAVKDFRSRIRENSDDLGAFRILTNSATIRSHAFFRVKKSFTALPERAKQDSLGVCSALSEVCVFVDSQPGASLAAHAASLCPRLICSAHASAG
jgi:hypothetical protein